MPNNRHYPRAPITEALIDIRVSYPPGVSLEVLKRFGSEVHELYPHQAARKLVHGAITLGDPAQTPTHTTRSTLGYIFHSADRRQAVQARLDGFTFSRFAPYENWEHLRDEAKRLWGIFVRMLEPAIVLRVAVRYINQINLPLREGTLTFENYLRTFPDIGVEGNVTLEQFFMRLVMPQADLAAKLILTEGHSEQALFLMTNFSNVLKFRL